MENAKLLETLFLGGVDLKRDFVPEKMGKLIGLPKLKVVVSSVVNVGEFSNGNSILKNLLMWEREGKKVIFDSFSGISNVNQDFVDFLMVAPLTDRVYFNDLARGNITAEQFGDLIEIADNKKMYFKFEPELIIAYSDVIVKDNPPRGSYRYRIVDQALRDYYQILSVKVNNGGNVDNEMQIRELNKLGIDGEKLLKRFFPGQFK
jgi:hypothetical protein